MPNSQTIRPQKFLTLTPISDFIKRRVFKLKNLIIKNYLRNIYLLVRKHLMILFWKNEKYTYKVKYKTIAVLPNDSTAFLTKIIKIFAVLSSLILFRIFRSNSQPDILILNGYLKDYAIGNIPKGIKSFLWNLKLEVRITYLIWIRPEEITEKSLIRDVSGPHNTSDLLHRLKIGA